MFFVWSQIVMQKNIQEIKSKFLFLDHNLGQYIQFFFLYCGPLNCFAFLFKHFKHNSSWKPYKGWNTVLSVIQSKQKSSHLKIT